MTPVFLAETQEWRGGSRDSHRTLSGAGHGRGDRGSRGLLLLALLALARRGDLFPEGCRFSTSQQDVILADELLDVHVEVVFEAGHLTGHLLLVLAVGPDHRDLDPLVLVHLEHLVSKAAGEGLLGNLDAADGANLWHGDRLELSLLGCPGAFLGGAGDNLAHHLRRLGVADTLRLNLVEPPQKRLVLLQVPLVVKGQTLLAGQVLQAVHHPPGLDDHHVQVGLASLELLLADFDNVLARAERLAGVVVELKLGASLDESLLGGGGTLQNEGEALIPVALGRTTLLLLRLHVHRLEVVIELEVDGSLSRSQLDVHRDLLGLDLVNLRCSA